MKWAVFVCLFACMAVLFSPFAEAEWLKTDQGCDVFMNKVPEKARASWSGGCVDGKAGGEGTFMMTTEQDEGLRTSEITGRMREGRFTGKVRMVRGNGDQFEGELIGGKLLAAKVVYADGRTYSGPLENGLPNGNGEMVYASGLRYIGALKSGIREGRGIAEYQDGSRYRGGWQNDRRHGAGIYITSQGMIIAGTFKKGRLRGRARFTRPDGYWFEGPTKNQNPHGKGICGSTKSKEVIECVFRKGKFVR